MTYAAATVCSMWACVHVCVRALMRRVCLCARCACVYPPLHPHSYVPPQQHLHHLREQRLKAAGVKGRDGYASLLPGAPSPERPPAVAAAAQEEDGGGGGADGRGAQQPALSPPTAS